MNTTVLNIINTLQRFHSDLGDYYFAQKENTHDSRVRSLLDYLGRSERYIENSISYQRRNLYGEVMNSIISVPLKIKFPPKKHSDYRLDSFEKVMTFALRMDSLLINYCDKIKDNVDDEIIQQAFKSLCKITKIEKRNIITYNSLFA